MNHDIYICIQDKKTQKTHQFSSDIVKFGNTHVAKIVSDKDLPLVKVEKFNACITKMQDKHLNSMRPEVSDTSSDSKKPTEASSVDQKSECSKAMLESSDYETRYSPFDNITHGQPVIFDQKSHFETGQSHLSKLLAPDSLLFVDLANEMSFQERPSSLFDLNQVS